jgi:germination protein YpeB
MELSSYAGKLSNQLNQSVSEMGVGALTFEDISRTAQTAANAATTTNTSMSSNLVNAETEFDQYASLIYDGPFSAHTLNQKPKLLEGKAMVTADKAAENAAKILHLQKSQLKAGSSGDGNIPTYSFTYGEIYIEVTKQGGIIMNITNNKTINEPRLDTQTAIKKAKEFMNANGYTDMKENYYEVRDNAVIVNFAYTTPDGITCYPDLIKVGVALDDGSIIFYEARGYITSHFDRKIGKPKFTMEQSKTKLASDLKVEKARLAVIPAKTTKEVLCWEFKCKGFGDRIYLVYINAETGAEEQIQILIINENGTLTI